MHCGCVCSGVIDGRLSCLTQESAKYQFFTDRSTITEHTITSYLDLDLVPPVLTGRFGDECLHLAQSLAVSLASFQSTPSVSRSSFCVSCHVLFGLPSLHLSQTNKQTLPSWHVLFVDVQRCHGQFWRNIYSLTTGMNYTLSDDLEWHYWKVSFLTFCVPKEK